MTDFAVVGGGVAGCVVARTLADSGASVVLFEAGKSDLPPRLRGPNWLDQDDAGWRWPGTYPRGLGLGGGSAINGMVAATGSSGDYDAWPEGWQHADLAPYFERVLTSLTPWTPPLGSLAAALALQGAEISPVALLSTAAGSRTTFADAYLSEIPATLRIETETAVDRLLTADRQMVGVVTTDGHETHAGHTVVCAGTYGTAELLTRSGIDLGASEPFDHRSATLTLELAPGLTPNSPESPPISAIVKGDEFEILIMDHTGGDRTRGALVVGEMSPGGLAPGLQLAENMAQQLIADGKATGARENPGSYYHAGATLPLGQRVDGTGRPEGWSGLHVIDASVLPTLPRCSPSVSIAGLAMKMAQQLGAAWGAA